MLHNFALKNRQHHLCAAAIAIFNYLLSGDEYKAVTTWNNEPLTAEFNVYFLPCTASAYLLILSLYRIMHDDTLKKQNFV